MICKVSTPVVRGFVNAPHGISADLTQNGGSKACFLKTLSQNGIRLNVVVIQCVSVYPEVPLGIC